MTPPKRPTTRRSGTVRAQPGATVAGAVPEVLEATAAPAVPVTDSSLSPTAKDTVQMNVKDLVTQIKAAQPEALASVPNGRAMLILREAFRIMKEELASTEEGIVSVPMLGQFRIRQVEVEKDGQTVRNKRTLFIESRGRTAPVEGASAH
jgi:hypothetical protein